MPPLKKKKINTMRCLQDAKKDDKKPAAAAAKAAPAAAAKAAPAAAAKPVAAAAAKPAADAPPALPAGWAAHLDPMGKTFFVCAAAKITQWEFPRAVFVPHGGTPTTFGTPGQPMTAADKIKADFERRQSLQAASVAGHVGGGGSLSGYAVNANMATTDNNWAGAKVKGPGAGINAMPFVAGGYWFYV